MFYTIYDNKIFISIKAQPKASRNEIVGLYGDDAIKIRIKAPAVEGAANKELIKFLAKELKVSKSEIEFKSGESNKNKTIIVPNSSYIVSKLQEWIE